ncbi:MAG: hypothetical protein NWF14_06215 [Candidatus Bathyarchaeota archaeon]|nr:hypothetical protein [Candidatus Bathyarchaeota archaeon]
MTTFGQLTFVAVDFNEIPEGFTIINRDTTYEGDLVIDGNKSVLIENCSFAIKGRIVVSDSSTLVIRDAKVRLIESRESEVGEGEFWFNISGDSRFQAINIAIETIYFRSFSIHISGSADVLFSNVYSLEWYGLVCEGSSKVRILDSVCWSMVEARGSSQLSVRNSRIYGVGVAGDSKALLEGVYTTKASAEESGFLEIHNSTISSGTEGLELIFDKGTRLTLRSFPTKSSGIGYEFCGSWALHRDNDVSNSFLNVTLDNVYLKLVQFVIGEGSDVGVYKFRNNLANIVCSNDKLKIVDSTLNEVVVLKDCILNASSAEIAEIEASQQSSARIEESKIGLVRCANETIVVISSSEIDSLETRDGAILQLNNCSLPETTSTLGNSIIFHSIQTISMSEFDYIVGEGLLNVRILPSPDEEIMLNMIMNRDRIRKRRDLGISVDGESTAFDIRDEKDLRMISFSVSLGISHLSISMGPPPPKRVPFFLTEVGQQLISLTIILALVIAVILAWR